MSCSFSVVVHQLTSQSENCNLDALWHCWPQISHVIILRRDCQMLLILMSFSDLFNEGLSVTFQPQLIYFR